MLYPSQQNPYVAKLSKKSKKLSKNILDSYCKSTKFKKRGLSKRDDLTGTNWSKIPVTIVEMGFMSNPEEDQKLSDNHYQSMLAEGIADGVDRYYERRGEENEEKMNYRDHRITCDRSTCHGINESDGRSGYQLVSELSDRRNEIFGIKSWMDPWNFRIVFRNVSVRDSDHCSWRSPWDDLYDRCNDELSEYEERYDRVCCVDHYIGCNIYIIFCFEGVCFIITDQQWRFYNQFF